MDEPIADRVGTRSIVGPGAGAGLSDLELVQLRRCTLARRTWLVGPSAGARLLLFFVVAFGELLHGRYSLAQKPARCSDPRAGSVTNQDFFDSAGLSGLKTLVVIGIRGP